MHIYIYYIYYIYIYINIYIYIYRPIYIDIYWGTSGNIFAQKFGSSILTDKPMLSETNCACANFRYIMYMYIYVYIYVYVYVYVYVYIYVYVYVYIYMYRPIHLSVYRYRYPHLYLSINTNWSPLAAFSPRSSGRPCWPRCRCFRTRTARAQTETRRPLRYFPCSDRLPWRRPVKEKQFILWMWTR